MLPQWFAFNPRFAFLLALLSAIVAPLALNYYVRLATSDRLYNEPAGVPTKPVAIVFGAGLWQDGTPTPMLADRVRAAADLYHQSRVSKILMTGDNSSSDYNEVKAMQEYAVKQGVSLTDITLDYAGFSTYESCYRAKEIFGVSRAVLVTQKYHLPRAVYTCSNMGIEAVGLGTPDWEKFENDSMRYYFARELLAVLKALWEVHITRPKPTFLGPFEGIE